MNNVYSIITEKIIKQLNAGIIPWQRPWKPTDAPRNIRGTRYTGINTLMLETERQDANYQSNVWLTYKQAAEAGGDVTGQKSTQVIYVSTYTIKDAKGSPKLNSKGNPETGYSLRYYNVFNADQVKNLTIPAAEATPEFSPIEAAEKIVRSYPNSPVINHGGDRAYYKMYPDTVQMPPRESFITPQHYYTTLFHELGHSTGHASRLNRWTPTENHNFGSKDYSKEELIAEMTATYLMSAAGIENPETEKNTVAYLQSWIKALNDDTTMIIRAASAAQKAADYVQNIRTHAEATAE